MKISLTTFLRARPIRTMIFAGVLLGALSVIFANRCLGNDEPSKTAVELNSVENSIPFYELTIPYLRVRDYKSTLGARVEYQKNSNYTTYLTNYDSDGLRINALMTIPAGEMPNNGWPAIVFVHGYIPPSIYQTTEKYGDYIDYLAKSGYVVLKVDLRGHGDSEGNASGAYYSGDYVIDTLNAYSALQSSGFVNPDKIGLWGHSMAGNVVFRSFVAKTDIPAVVIWAGAVYTYSDLGDYGIDDNSYRPPTDNSIRRKFREVLSQTHGDFSVDSEFWKLVAPTNFLDGVSGALQINHAIDDTVVDIGYSRNLMKVLGGSSVIHELNEYGSGGHNISGSAFSSAMQNTVSFYNKHLK